MRTLTVAAALFGMVVSLQAKQADSLRGLKSSDPAVKQFVGNQNGQHQRQSGRTKSDGRKERDFPAEAIVPDICTGC